MTAQQISLAVVDDHPLFREGVIRSLTEMDGFNVVGEGSSKEDALRIAVEHQPDILLLDISMPGGGLEAISLILDRVPGQKIVMLTVSEAGDDVMAALRNGAKGYVLKGVGSRALADIIRSVAAGDSYVAPTLSARLISESGSGARARCCRATSMPRRGESAGRLVPARAIASRVSAIAVRSVAGVSAGAVPDGSSEGNSRSCACSS